MMKQVVFLILATMALSGCQRTADNDNGQDIALAPPHIYTDAEKAAIQATFPAPYNTADLNAGQIQFGKCRSCHTISADKMNLVGPHLYGVFGRKSGTEPGYTFSEAMTRHNVVWDFDTLDTYLAAPQAVVKGTKMSYAGIQNETDRRNLIAYLKLETTPYVPPATASAGASETASSQ
ncbi:c-type cytochrome [Asticcacaulis sp. AC466]|uniref:c-type cytochrome n=1 Tax=Asticcacaulis sp. AC466 TaxID=1282362 RepID=UPI001F30F56B|nr:cytochrome c family protein [Asticcacaulis sp. AC466]